MPTTRRCGPHLCDIITGRRGDLDGQGTTAPGQTWPCTDLPHRDKDLVALTRNAFPILCYSLYFLHNFKHQEVTLHSKKHVASSHADWSCSVAPQITINFNNIFRRRAILQSFYTKGNTPQFSELFAYSTPFSRCSHHRNHKGFRSLECFYQGVLLLLI